MKKRDCRYLARTNLKAHRGIMFKVRLFLMLSVLLCSLFLSVMTCLRRQYAQLTGNNTSMQYIAYETTEEADAKAFRIFAVQQPEVLSVSVAACSVMMPPDSAYTEAHAIERPIEESFLNADGTITVGEAQSAGRELFMTMNLGYTPVYLQSYVLDNPATCKLIPDCMREEYRIKHGTENVFLAGGEFTAKKQIIMSEYMLTCYGYPAETQAELIGKTVSLGVIDGEQRKLCLENYTLVGILKTEYFGLSGMGSFAPQIWIPYDADENNLSHRFDIGLYVNHGFAVWAYADSFQSLDRLTERFSENGFPVRLNLTQKTAVFLYDGIMLLNKMVSFILMFFILIMLISVCNGLYFYYHAMRENYRMLSLLGAEQAAVRRISVYELSSIFIRSFVFSALLSAGISKVISKIPVHLLRFEIKMNWRDILTGVGITGGFLLILFTAVYLVFPRRMLSDNQA